MFYTLSNMFVDDSAFTASSVETTCGLGVEVNSTNDTLAIAAGVVGAGVLGTGLVIGTYAAPAPMIGGALLATGLGIAAGTLNLDEKSDEEKELDRKIAAKEAELDAKADA